MSKLNASRAERLDQCVVRQFPGLSRAYATKLIAAGKVTVNKQIIIKSGHKLRINDVVNIDYNPDAELLIPDISLEILYEDSDCVVINKSLGVLTHSKGAFNPEATVATWLRGRLLGMSGDRAGIVHRLDRATSGVMICAKNQTALTWLQKQFSQRRVKKAYTAVVSGTLTPREAILDLPIERNPRKPQTFRVGSNGKPAITEYEVIKQTTSHCLVELRPTTGRTHQLRVHLSHQGHPILGDTLYGGEPAERLFLHAHRLEITLPSKQREQFTAHLPSAFNQKISK